MATNSTALKSHEASDRLARACGAVERYLALRGSLPSFCFIQLGRYGDLLNILPVVYLFSRIWGKPIPIVVHEQFADLLESVSYATAHQYTGDIVDLKAATKSIKHLYANSVCTQLHGNPIVRETTDSFCTTSWQLAGCDRFWDDLSLLVDKRDQIREKQLRATFYSTKPKILVACSGWSSPFPHKEDLIRHLEKQWTLHVDIVCLDDIRAVRLYDLLGLMEDSLLLIATDSAPLHLSYAALVPTIGITTNTPTPWHGTKPRSHWIANIRYNDLLDNLPLIDSCIRRHLESSQTV